MNANEGVPHKFCMGIILEEPKDYEDERGSEAYVMVVVAYSRQRNEGGK